MHQLDLGNGVDIAYEDDWLGAPWRIGEPLLMVHGMGEAARAWHGWVPHLAQRFRVIRPDLPGFGASTVPDVYEWTPARLAADLARFMDRLGIARAHVVAAKYGGSAALKLAADHPDKVRTLSLFGSPAKAPPGPNGIDVMKEKGVLHWARATMRTRLGSAASDEQVRWWAGELMGLAPLRSAVGVGEALSKLDLEDDCARIQAPTLVVTTQESGLQAVAAVRRYQERIPDSRLLVIDSDCYHIAAAAPDRCADIVAGFLAEQGA